MPRWRVTAVAGAARALLPGTGGRADLGRPCYDPDLPAVTGFDQSPLNALLGRYVDDTGLVAYARWKENAADLTALDGYLTGLGRVDRRRPASRADRIAFWVNVYNAVTLAGVLRRYPAGCACRGRGGVFGFRPWRDVRVWVGAERVTPDRIEHDFLRRLAEPRVHFALVCAARGCPPLRPRAYTAAGIDDQLDDNARRFFARPGSLRLDPATRTVTVSRLLKWVGREFAATPAACVRSLRRYFPDGAGTDWIDVDPVRVRYAPYAWDLNDAAPPAACPANPLVRPGGGG